MTFKQKVYGYCLQLLNEKAGKLTADIEELKAGAEADSKSSAGDKHETARSMMQLEQEKLSKQLNDILGQKKLLEKIDTAVCQEKISIGSLVKTDSGFFFLGPAIGKITVDNQIVFVISPESPLGKSLSGRLKGDNITVNNTPYSIIEVA